MYFSSSRRVGPDNNHCGCVHAIRRKLWGRKKNGPVCQIGYKSLVLISVTSNFFSHSLPFSFYFPVYIHTFNLSHSQAHACEFTREKTTVAVCRTCEYEEEDDGDEETAVYWRYLYIYIYRFYLLPRVYIYIYIEREREEEEKKRTRGK